MAEHLAATARRADELRREASRSLTLAVRQAQSLGWTQRRIGKALGRSQPEVARLLREEPVGSPLAGDPAADRLLSVVLRDKRDEIVQAAMHHGARNVRLFGSVARGDDGPGSDVDLLVDLNPGVGLFALGALEVELERILGRKVDVVPAGSLRPEVAATVEAVPL
ncbi:hypothetical protein ET471_05910 [Xylanimonas protaetiae]|uniref:Polymerase nucleotidyl transferase domain-containing protein n=2 Tax=Xylanimonas protaetiae TaxID=2509457 RepID=A0A4P6FMB6_9MICO|nr:hypothetical protein ET471_05910 [Xylanimonas protaetiae]